MSSQPGEAFLPPLDKCLARSVSVLPWKTAQEQLLLSEKAGDLLELKAFLIDEKSLATLINAVQPFERPSQASKQALETRTAPINISSTTNGRKDIDQLKDDATWLSTQLEIDEVTCLRLALLEWQQRSADMVLGKVEPNAVAKSVERPVGSSAEALTDEARHRRQLAVFLEEKSAIRTICALLVSLDASDKTMMSSVGQEPWLATISESLRTSRSSKRTEFVTTCLAELSKQIDLLEDNKAWPSCFRVDFSLHDAYLSALLQDMCSILRQTLTHVFHVDAVTSPENVLTWFRLMRRTTYFKDLSPSSPTQVFFCEILQTLVAVLSSAILKLPEAIADLERIAEELGTNALVRQGEKSYPHDDACLKELNLLLFEAATYGTTLAAPAIYTWSIISMYIRDIARAEQDEIRQIEDENEAAGSSGRHGSVSRRPSAIELKYDALQDMNLGPARDDPPQHLARQAVDDLNVYSVVADLSRIVTNTYSVPLEAPLAETCRNVLYDLVRESLPLVTYDEHVVEATLAILAPATTSPEAINDHIIAAKFLRDRVRYMPLIFDQAISRYPYELTPLLQIITALGNGSSRSADQPSNAADTFTHLESMTLTLPEGFRGYTLEHEEEGANTFRLVEDLPLFITKPLLRAFTATSNGNEQVLIDSGSSQAQSIPRGTAGVILRDSRPFIVRLQHKHNGLHYLSRLLETFLKRALCDVAPPAIPIDSSVCYEIISLINTLLKSASNRDTLTSYLEQLREALPEGLDIVSIIAEIMETELLTFAEQSGISRPTELLVSCISFLVILQQHSPERVWSILSQSSLLGNGGGVNIVSGVINGASDGYLQFTWSFIRLYQATLDNALEGIVQRNKQSTRPTKGRRFDSPITDTVETPERTISSVITAYTRLVLDILQRLTADQCFATHAASMSTSCLFSSLQRLLISVYGLDGSDTSLPTFAAVLKPAADAFLAIFLADGLTANFLLPLVSPLQSVAKLHNDYLPSSQRKEIVAQCSASLQLLTILVRVSQYTGRSNLALATSLTHSVTVLTTLYAAQPCLRKDIAELLVSMICGLAVNEGEPPSIFSQLSSPQGRHFLHLLTELDQPLQDVKTECAVWNLFSAACEYGQQWFAMYLLTGILPRDRLKSDGKPIAQTMLSKALDLLVDIKNLAPERALAMTIFVSKAQKLWVWATSLVRSHTDFLKSILTWLRELKPATRSVGPADALLVAREYTIAAALCDTLAVGVHASLNVGDKSIAKLIAPSLSFLAKHAVCTEVYNRALHNKLQENIAGRFSGLDIGVFKRTLVNPAPIGRSYIYDMEIAARALSHDESWAGNGKRGSSGFEEEFSRANTNWSLVDASKTLLTEWKTLATTLARSDDLPFEIVGALVTTGESCLEASLDADLDLPDMAVVLQTRADLTFGLLSRLSRSPVQGERSWSILQKAWALVRTSPVDFDIAKATDDLTYYRTLLRILLLSLNLHNATTKAPPNSASRTQTEQALAKVDFERGGLLVEVVTRTVTTGFRALCGNLHESTSTALPEDFAILTAILQSVLASSSAKQYTSQIADAVAFSAVVRSASSLFSWSDRLAELTEHDPVYGEMAAMFLVALSRVPQVAEQLALEGVLTQLSSANVTDYFRKPDGKGPFDRPSRMFVIWTDAFLPLCINMLEAVGPPVASEVSAFVNSFPQQLARAEKALVNGSPGPHDPHAGAITLGLLTEARDLILIAQILKASIELGAAEGIASAEVEELKYNFSSVTDDVEALTKSQRSLRDRITPVGAREAALYADKAVDGCDNALEATISKEIMHIKASIAES